MKKIITMLVLMASLAVASAIDPVDAILTWDYDGDESTLVDYVVYEQTGPDVWTQIGIVPVGNVDPRQFVVVLDGLPHNYAVTARNAFFESDRSNVVAAPTVAKPPANFRIIRSQN
jgi:hypothetical protein